MSDGWRIKKSYQLKEQPKSSEAVFKLRLDSDA